jgi:hypothetical protein
VPDDQVVDIRMDTGVVRMTWAEGTHITGELAHDALAVVHELIAGRAHSVLVDVTGITTMSREARMTFATRGEATRVAILGRSAVNRVVANFALGTGPLLTRFFTSETAAFTWLLDADDSRSSPES